MITRPAAAPRAFTLIELLVVVAVIAILAAIAIPNFLEAQVRAKVSRVKSDQRVLAAAMEAYAVHHGVYPPDQDNNIQHQTERGFLLLTTPIAFITSLYRDPFSPPFDPAMADAMNIAAHYYMASGSDNERENNPAIGTVNAFAIISIGPNQRDDAQRTDSFPFLTNFDVYDPTNGSTSRGEVLRFGGNYRSGTWTLNDLPYGLWSVTDVMPQ